jgi:mannose-6-phosphate isomerase-like protein (cupin superfamily)
MDWSSQPVAAAFAPKPAVVGRQIAGCVAAPLDGRIVIDGEPNPAAARGQVRDEAAVAGLRCEDAADGDHVSMNRPTSPEGVRAARDLTVDAPRPFGLELDGYAHLPRMLDKARATLAGTAGEYLFGCPVDHTCMARLGVAPELVLDLAARHADDRRVLEALREHGIPPARDAWFDAVAVEDELQEGTYLRVRRREELPANGDGRVFAGDEHGADIDIVLVEVAPGDGGGAPTATTTQVWVIQEGQATFFLGALQARVLHAGEVVRIPADVPWRFENTGAAALRAVAVSPARAH